MFKILMVNNYYILLRLSSINHPIHLLANELKSETLLTICHSPKSHQQQTVEGNLLDSYIISIQQCNRKQPQKKQKPHAIKNRNSNEISFVAYLPKCIQIINNFLHFLQSDQIVCIFAQKSSLRRLAGCCESIPFFT